MTSKIALRVPQWSNSSVLDHRSLPPVFESRRGHIWWMFHLWICLITFGGRSAHLTYHVHKSGHKTPIIIIINKNNPLHHIWSQLDHIWSQLDHIWITSDHNLITSDHNLITTWSQLDHNAELWVSYWMSAIVRCCSYLHLCYLPTSHHEILP